MDSGAPEAKRKKTDGHIDAVDKSILAAAQDHEAWIAERKKNWPSSKRIAEKLAEEAAKPRNSVVAGEEKQSDSPSETGQSSKPKKPLCRYFMRGRCASGNRCRFSHERPTKPMNQPSDRVYNRFEPPTKASLFVKLVQNDHDQEDESFLDFVEFLDSNNLLQ